MPIGDNQPKMFGPDTEIEHMLVVTLPDGTVHSWPKRDRKHAEQGVKDMVRDRKKSKYYEGAVIDIATRQVGEWETVDEYKA